MQEKIVLSTHEMQRFQVLGQVARGSMTLKGGARLMGVCYRQAKRLLARLQREGPKGLAHRRRGRAAPNAFGPEMRDRVLALHQQRYAQFNDTHFVQMLEEREHLRIGRETVRRWLRAAGIAPKRRRRPPQHWSCRPRRPQEGLMAQWDGSPHRWFGPQHPPCSLLHATDDAGGKVLGALFRPQEDAIGYLKLLDMIVRRHGVPAAIYQDRHSALHRNDNNWATKKSWPASASPPTSAATPQPPSGSPGAASGPIGPASYAILATSSNSTTKRLPPPSQGDILTGLTQPV